MPSDPAPLGFANRWFPYAMETAQTVALAADLSIRLIAAPAFVACKFEAHAARGIDHLAESRDLEDIVTLIDARPSLLDEVSLASSEVRTYIAQGCRHLVDDVAFLDALAGFMLGDPASQARAPILRQRLRALGALAPAPDKQ